MLHDLRQWVLLSLTVLGMGCGEQPSVAPVTDGQVGLAPAEVANDSLATVRQSVVTGTAQLVDVRSTAEWDEVCLQEATHIPLQTLESKELQIEALGQLDKSKPVYIHCMKGGRAQRAAALLGQLGFDTRPLLVNFAELPEAGFIEVRPGTAAD